MATLIFVLITAVIVPAAKADCGKTTCEPFSITGRVHFVDIEGGFWGIVAENGRCYDPINLPARLQREGLRARFTLRALRNQFNSHMWGMMVNIVGYNLTEN